MVCIDCKATNPDDNRFCGQCGAELGRSLDETIRKKGFRDRMATEMEIMDAVVGRLMKWVRWLGTIAAVIIVLFGLLLGKSYMDVSKVVDSGKKEIETAIQKGTEDVEKAKQAIKGMNNEIAKLNSDTARYKKVNSDIGKLQNEFNNVKEQVVDLGTRTLRVKRIEATGPGPNYLSFTELGCPSTLGVGEHILLCAKGSPTSFFQLNSMGELRPVSSFSPVGFQDVSTGPKPTCSATSRGTFYVEKGTGKVADKPFLCAKQLDNTYDWIQLSTK
jgi:hypothetical protein